jgi:hypothetical protein
MAIGCIDPSNLLKDGAVFISAILSSRFLMKSRSIPQAVFQEI